MATAIAAEQKSLTGTSLDTASRTTVHPRRQLGRGFYGKIFLLLLIGVFGLLAGCVGPGNSGDDEGFENFKDAAASDRNYDMYWLGRSFEAGSLVFEGPDVGGVPGIGDIEGGGLSISYGAAAGDVCCLGFYLVLYSRPAWNYIQDLRANRRHAAEDMSQVVVNGRPGQLRTLFDPPGELHSQVLAVDMGDTVVEASTTRVEPKTPGEPQLNELLDRETFLAVMQNLRPYPE